jgi:hypothetical protein
MLSTMRKTAVFISMIVLLGISRVALAQTSAAAQLPGSDEALLTKVRGLYDAPFTRGLVSFDCAVQFDWKKHVIDFVGAVPPPAAGAIEHLQNIQHRVFVDRSGATVSTIPKAPDLAGIEHAAELEQAFTGIVSAGLNTWLPFSTNVILPVKPTKFSFEGTSSGYALTLNGPGVAAKLQLTDDMRVTSGVSQLPQPLQFLTTFAKSSDGFILSSIRTESTLNSAQASDVTFAFTYQTVQGFQIPSSVTIIPATKEIWNYNLTDCKAVKGINVTVSAPPKLETEHKVETETPKN